MKLSLNIDAAAAVLACQSSSLRALAKAGGLQITKDFRQLDLRCWPLAGQDLRGFDFSGCDLRETGIETAICDESTLLTNAVLDGADLHLDIPQNFLELAYVMILNGEAPPSLWVPEIVKLDFYLHCRSALDDLRPLAGLTALAFLDLRYSNVRDLAPLRNLVSLKTLSLWGTQVDDISPLAELPLLRILYLADTPISELPPLSRVSPLEVIQLSNTQIKSISPLQNIKTLKEIHLTNTPVRSVSDLDKITELRDLYISGTNIVSLRKLSKAEQLTVHVESDTRADALRATLEPKSKVKVEGPNLPTSDPWLGSRDEIQKLRGQVRRKS